MDAAKRKVKRLADTYARCPDAGEGEEQTLMALVTTEKMLKDAQAGHYAVGAFNVENLEFVMAVLAAAEETKSPVIMQTTPGTIKTAGLDYFYGMVKAAAERASVPVALHLDHGDGYDRCMQAFRTGYTSVMIDGSHESFEDNIALTKSVADAGRAMGVPVEAELGKVGGKEDDGPAVEGESPYTDPAEAKEFVERTGCTSLAIGVGTSHGVYTSDPHIEQSVVKAIRDAVDVPLVLHGTSGVPDEQVAEAVKNGICKVNYATELRQAYTKGFMAYMAENPACFDPKKPAKEGMREIIRRERLIELALEGHRYWDLLRWKLATDYFNQPITGWDVSQSDAEAYYQVKTIYNRTFVAPRDYFNPIPNSEMNVNGNLVQNPGW